MWKAFSEQGSYRWLELLPELVTSYNKSFHRTIGMKPVEVNNSNEKSILLKVSANRKKNVRKVKNKFDIGDHVSISRHLSVFTKGYFPRWSNEIYTVWKVQPSVPSVRTGDVYIERYKR